MIAEGRKRLFGLLLLAFCLCSYGVVLCLTRLGECVLQADAKPIESCLSDGSIGMSRAIMEGIASGSVLTCGCQALCAVHSAGCHRRLPGKHLS